MYVVHFSFESAPHLSHVLGLRDSPASAEHEAEEIVICLTGDGWEEITTDVRPPGAVEEQYRDCYWRRLRHLASGEIATVVTRPVYEGIVKLEHKLNVSLNFLAARPR